METEIKAKTDQQKQSVAAVSVETSTSNAPQPLTRHELIIICLVCIAYMLLQPSTVFLGTIRCHEDMDSIGVFLMVYFIAYVSGCILHAHLMDVIQNVFVYFVNCACFSLCSALVFIFAHHIFILIPILLSIISAVSASALLPCLMHFISIYYSNTKLYSVMCIFALFKIGFASLFDTCISLAVSSTDSDWMISIYVSLAVGVLGVLIFIITSYKLCNPEQISKETEPLPALSLATLWQIFTQTPYVPVIAPASFLVVLYTLNPFTTMMIADIYGSDSSVRIVTGLMIPIGMSITIIVAMCMNGFNTKRIMICNQWSVFIYELGLIASIVILCILTLLTWLAELDVIACANTTSCVVTYDLLFLLYGCTISYPLLVTVFVALLNITKHKISVNIAASFLNGFMCLTSGTYSILSVAFARSDVTMLRGWKWVTLLLIPFAVGTVYLYHKLVTDKRVWKPMKETRSDRVPSDSVRSDSEVTTGTDFDI